MYKDYVCIDGWQEREAGRIKNAEGDVLGAITLFLKGGLPWLAADCVNNNSSYVLKVYDTKKRIMFVYKRLISSISFLLQ
jgi:hypothetical protein